MTYKVLSLEDTEEWEKYISKLPVEQQDIYYSPAYYTLFENLGNGKAQCFVFENKSGEVALYPFLLNAVNDLGYDLDANYYDIQGAYGYNGVITSTNQKEFVDAFYKAFALYCKNERIIAEFTRFNPLLSNQRFSDKYMQCILDRQTVYIDLTNDYDEIKRNYQRSTRKQISRMRRNEAITVERLENCSEEMIDLLFDIYIESMKRLSAKEELFFSFEFFSDLLKNPDVEVIIFNEDGERASFISYFHYNKRIHGFLGGTRSAFLRRSPFSLLYDEMIKIGKDKGCEVVHVGGGTSSDPDDNLLTYKLHFSDKTKDFYIGKKVHDETTYSEVIEQWKRNFASESELDSKLLLKYRNVEN